MHLKSGQHFRPCFVEGKRTEIKPIQTSE